MLLWWRPKCTAEWFIHRRVFPREISSCSFSALATSVQSDYSSGDEKPNFAPDNEIIRRQSRFLSSDNVVQTLRCLKRSPAVAFAYFKDTESIGFRHDFSTYSEIIHILSHSCQGKKLVSLFCEIVSPTGSGGPEVLALINHLSKTFVTSHTLSFACNCLIKAYTIHQNAHATIEIFSHLCRLGYVPSAWTCNFVLKFVARSSETEMVVAVYDQMKCSQLTLDARSLDIVARSLFQAKKADEAFQVWFEMIEMGVKPDAFGYSSFVIGLCECGQYDRAHAVLQMISRERIPIGAMAYNMVVDGLCKEMKLEEAEKVLKDKTKQGYAPDVYSFSYLIRSYCKMGDLAKAWDHYEAMKSHGIKINCHIAGYLLQSLSKLGMTSEFITHFQEFRDSGIHLDGVLYNIAMDAYCKDGNMDEAVKLLNEMMAGGLAPDNIHYTCLINGYCLKGEMQDAHKVFEQMLVENIKPDIVTYNILASGFCRSGCSTDILKLLDHMADQGLEDSLTYGIAIDCLCREKKLSAAVELFRRVEYKGIDNIVVLYSAMVCGYLRSGWTNHAYMLFALATQRGHLVDYFTCSKLINDLCRDENVKDASNVFNTMLNNNVVPDVISYSNLISAYCQTGNMYSARSWFQKMIVRGPPPDVIVCTVLMNGYCRAGHLEEACALFNEMIRSDIKPDVVAYTVLLDGRLKEILQRRWQGIDKESRSFLLRDMHKELLSRMADEEIEPDVQCYTVLIDGLCKAEFLDEAQELFDEMLRKGLTPDVYTYTALIKGYCGQGKIAKAHKLMQEMEDKGNTPNVYAYTALINGYRSQGRIAEANDLIHEMNPYVLNSP